MGLWIDLPTEQLLGFNPLSIVHHITRKLRMEDPRVVTTYTVYFYDAFRDHGLYTYPLTLHLVAEYDDIDVIVCRLMDESYM